MVKWPHLDHFHFIPLFFLFLKTLRPLFNDVRPLFNHFRTLLDRKSLKQSDQNVVIKFPKTFKTDQPMLKSFRMMFVSRSYPKIVKSVENVPKLIQTLPNYHKRLKSEPTWSHVSLMMSSGLKLSKLCGQNVV